MIRAYNEQLVSTVRDKLAAIFELAVNEHGMDIDSFAERFVSSRVCRAFEKADPVFVLGKSANELLAVISESEPTSVEISDFASPEYWVGWVLAYTQWYLNKPYKMLINAVPCGELLLKYFPYHEMDVMKTVELFQTRLPRISSLKKMRKAKKLSQNDLAVLSGVPVRTIKAYEQGTVDISKAHAETLYSLSQVLKCSIEELLKDNASADDGTIQKKSNRNK